MPVNDLTKPIEINLPECVKCSYRGKVPLLYLYVFQLMVKKLGKTNQVTTSKQLLEFWHRNIYNVPRAYDYHILSEMCEYGLIERINTQKYMFYGGRAQQKLRRLNDFFLWNAGKG